VRPSISARRAAAPPVDANTEIAPTRSWVALNTMIAVNVLFVAYNALEAMHLFGGRPPSGMTTQQYAHQGALWLTVALFLLTVVVGSIFHGPIARHPKGRLVRALGMAWVGQGLVVALSTYGRIAIHIQHSGLSNLRIVGILGTTLVVAGVVMVGIKLRRDLPLSWLVTRQLEAFAITVVLFAITPTHYISARVNVARIERGELAPLLHMPAQSREIESAPVLIELLSHPDPIVREGVAALLERERITLHSDVEERSSFRERDLLAAHVSAELDAASERIRRASSTTTIDDEAAARMNDVALAH
jgi:hypothetical protein